MPNSKRKADTCVRVLVVEDDRNDQELLLHQLGHVGLDEYVKFISSGKEALEFLTGPRIESVAKDLVALFLDLKLPSLGGLELLRRLRRHEEYVDLPVIVMTSSTDPEDWEECRRLEVVHFILKPVTLASFSKAVADVFHPPPHKKAVPALTLIQE